MVFVAGLVLFLVGLTVTIWFSNRSPAVECDTDGDIPWGRPAGAVDALAANQLAPDASALPGCISSICLTVAMAGFWTMVLGLFLL